MGASASVSVVAIPTQDPDDPSNVRFRTIVLATGGEGSPLGGPGAGGQSRFLPPLASVSSPTGAVIRGGPESPPGGAGMGGFGPDDDDDALDPGGRGGGSDALLRALSLSTAPSPPSGAPRSRMFGLDGFRDRERERRRHLAARRSMTDSTWGGMPVNLILFIPQSPSFVPKGLSESAVNDLRDNHCSIVGPTGLLESGVPASELDDCVICHDSYEPGQKLVHLPKCSHQFHWDCLTPWLERCDTCPLCRGVIHEDPSPPPPAASAPALPSADASSPTMRFVFPSPPSRQSSSGSILSSALPRIGGGGPRAHGSPARGPFRSPASQSHPATSAALLELLMSPSSRIRNAEDDEHNF